MIIDVIEKYVSKKVIWVNDHPRLVTSLERVIPGKSLDELIKGAESLCQNQISFTWTDPKEHKTLKISTSIIQSFDRSDFPAGIQIFINGWAILPITHLKVAMPHFFTT